MMVPGLALLPRLGVHPNGQPSPCSTNIRQIVGTARTPLSLPAVVAAWEQFNQEG